MNTNMLKAKMIAEKYLLTTTPGIKFSLNIWSISSIFAFERDEKKYNLAVSQQ